MFSKEFYIALGVIVIISCVIVFFMQHAGETPSDIYKRDYIDQGKGLLHPPHSVPAGETGGSPSSR